MEVFMNKNNYLYILTFAYAFSTFAQGIFMPIYAFFVQKIGGGILETSWAIAVYSILAGAGTIAIHKTSWSPRYRMHFLWFGWLLWVLSIGVYFVIVQNILTLYISQILNALGDALSKPIWDAEFTKKIERDPAQAWAFFEGTISIFGGIATLLGGFVATLYGFDVLLYCVMATAAISFLMIVYYLMRVE